jgi:hypothetical protein
LQLLTTGGVLRQGSTALVALTAVHAGVVAALFWGLLANAVVATQVVEDGTWSSLVVCVVSCAWRGDVELIFFSFFFAAVLCFVAPDIWVDDLPIP